MDEKEKKEDKDLSETFKLSETTPKLGMALVEWWVSVAYSIGGLFFFLSKDAQKTIAGCVVWLGGMAVLALFFTIFPFFL